MTDNKRVWPELGDIPMSVNRVVDSFGNGWVWTPELMTFTQLFGAPAVKPVGPFTEVL